VDGIDGEAGSTERLDVAKDRALRHFQLGGELRCCHSASRLEEAEKLDKPPGAHG